MVTLAKGNDFFNFQFVFLDDAAPSMRDNNLLDQLSSKILSKMHQVQSTLVISKSRRPSETLRDIRTSTYQRCRTEKNTNRTTKFHKRTCNLTPLVSNLC